MPVRDEAPFRVIVVGGGVAGLTASHCLQRAGIDHVVLEKDNAVAPPEGASIAIYPQGARILDQIGCLDSVYAAGEPQDLWYNRRADGKVTGTNGFLTYIEENHGYNLLLLERRAFLQCLFDGLPNKSYIRTGSAIKSIKHLDGGVEVTLRDGSVEKGDMVLGCDGVHSKSRSLMWEYADKTAPGLVTEKEKTTAFKTSWKCLAGIGPPMPSLGRSDLSVVSEKGYSYLLLTQPTCTYFFVFFHLGKSYSLPARPRYTQQDAEDLAATIADHPVSESQTFGEIWNNKLRGFLVGLEEGVMDHWHHGRIVLAGDAAHKFTPNIAMGGNAAMESVVVLCNHLQRMVKRQQGARPSAATLNSVFAAYQAERIERVRYIMNLSGLISKFQAEVTIWHKIANSWVLPVLPDRGVSDLLKPFIAAGPKIDYLPVTKKFKHGKVAWKDAKKDVSSKDAGRHLQVGKKSTDAASSGLVQVIRSLGLASVVAFLLYAARNTAVVSAFQSSTLTSP